MISRLASSKSKNLEGASSKSKNLEGASAKTKSNIDLEGAASGALTTEDRGKSQASLSTSTGEFSLEKSETTGSFKRQETSRILATALRWAELGEEVLNAEINADELNNQLIGWLSGTTEVGAQESSWLKKVADSNAMSIGVMVTVMINGIQMGIQTDYQGGVLDTVYWGLDNLFTLIFAVEMVIKILAHGRQYFSSNWNRFDCFLTWVSIVDMWVMPFFVGGSEGMKMLSVLRILRIFRAVRLLRMVRNFRELTLIITGFVEATKTTSWVCMLLILILYIFSIFCTNAVGKPGTYEAYDENGIEDAANFNSFQYFGTIPRSMFTLLNLVMLTDDWSIVSRAILEQQPFILCVLIVFVSFTTLGLMNVIIGIIAECVSSHAASMNHDTESLRRKELLEHLERLCEFVFSIDLNGDHSVDSNELELAWDRKDMKDILRAVRLPIGSDARELMDFLDTEGTNALDMEDFVKNFVRLLTNDMQQQVFEMRMQINRLFREFKSFKEEWECFKPRHESVKPQQEVSKESKEEDVHVSAEAPDGSQTAPGRLQTNQVDSKGSASQPEQQVTEQQVKPAAHADLNTLMTTWDVTTQLNRLEIATAKQVTVSSKITKMYDQLEVLGNTLSRAHMSDSKAIPNDSDGAAPRVDTAALAKTVTQAVVSELSPKLDGLQMQIAGIIVRLNQRDAPTQADKSFYSEPDVEPAEDHRRGALAIQTVEAIQESIQKYETKVGWASAPPKPDVATPMPADEVPREWRESLPQRRESALSCTGWEADCWDIDPPGERPQSSQRTCANGACVRRVPDSTDVSQPQDNVGTVRRYNPHSQL